MSQDPSTHDHDLGYAGDITPETAWEWMQNKSAVLIDVRTDAEREWVGFVPGAVAAAWKQWPGMQVNENFEAQVKAALEAAGVEKAALLCRSGVRSIAAAMAASDAGVQAYNILGGFEGDPNELGHRGTLAGWKKSGLPWKQN
jgi:rhodanese-related sulfurtransferase